MLGVPYQPLMGSEFGAWGSAMIAGKAAGIFDDLAEVAYEHAIPAGVRLLPDGEHVHIYQPLVQQYIQWQSELAQSFRKLK